jgi:hypothetical protein
MKKQSEGGIRMNRTEYRSNYLQSEWWKEKREKILDRDITCRICEKNPSNEVHHLSYEHLYAERNCELIGICRPCHDTIHGCKILSRMISPWIIKMLIVLTPAERAFKIPLPLKRKYKKNKVRDLPIPLGITAFAKPFSRFSKRKEKI